jgi:hypothetical protein
MKHNIGKAIYTSRHYNSTEKQHSAWRGVQSFEFNIESKRNVDTLASLGSGSSKIQPGTVFQAIKL